MASQIRDSIERSEAVRLFARRALLIDTREGQCWHYDDSHALVALTTVHQLAEDLGLDVQAVVAEARKLAR